MNLSTAARKTMAVLHEARHELTLYRRAVILSTGLLILVRSEVVMRRNSLLLRFRNTSTEILSVCRRRILVDFQRRNMDETRLIFLPPRIENHPPTNITLQSPKLASFTTFTLDSSSRV
jgi:hypothetical protein